MEKEKYMSGSEFRQTVHISTRKMKYLMDHNYIAHINTGNTTHKYLILREDVATFQQKMESDPFFLAELTGMFTSRKEHHPKPFFEINDLNIKAFREWLKNEWADRPEAVSVKQLSDRLGVTGNTVNNWVRDGKVNAVTLMGKRLCIKQTVIDFYASKKKLEHPADESYRELISEFKRRMCRERENEKRREKRKNNREEQ